MRRVDQATVAGYYGSDSAGTFATCVAVLTAVGIAFNAYMPVMLAVMEIPGCLVALYLVARLRHRGIGRVGIHARRGRLHADRSRSESGPARPPGPRKARALTARTRRAIEQELELSLEKMEHPDWEPDQRPAPAKKATHLLP